MVKDFKKNLMPSTEKRIAEQLCKRGGPLVEDSIFPNASGEIFLRVLGAGDIEYSQLLLSQIKAE